MGRPPPRERTLGPLGPLLDRLGQGLPAARLPQIRGIWADEAGAALAAHVDPIGWDGATLHLSADGAAWATQTEELAPILQARMRRRGVRVERVVVAVVADTKR